MEKNKAVGAQSELESLSRQGRSPRSGAMGEDPRLLADHELLLVGGGDEAPGWGHP
jgi:hypothetical protein